MSHSSLFCYFFLQDMLMTNATQNCYKIESQFFADPTPFSSYRVRFYNLQNNSEKLSWFIVWIPTNGKFFESMLVVKKIQTKRDGLLQNPDSCACLRSTRSGCTPRPAHWRASARLRPRPLRGTAPSQRGSLLGKARVRTPAKFQARVVPCPDSTPPILKKIRSKLIRTHTFEKLYT